MEINANNAFSGTRSFQFWSSRHTSLSWTDDGLLSWWDPIKTYPELWVEFPPGPVTVGNLAVTEFSKRQTRFGVLRLLPPTECVMDRLAHYYHFNDPQALDQAAAVARKQPVDLERIEEWSRGEAAGEKFRDFTSRLKQRAQ